MEPVLDPIPDLAVGPDGGRRDRPQTPSRGLVLPVPICRRWSRWRPSRAGAGAAAEPSGHQSTASRGPHEMERQVDELAGLDVPVAGARSPGVRARSRAACRPGSVTSRRRTGPALVAQVRDDLAVRASSERSDGWSTSPSSMTSSTASESYARQRPPCRPRSSSPHPPASRTGSACSWILACGAAVPPPSRSRSPRRWADAGDRASSARSRGPPASPSAGPSIQGLGCRSARQYGAIT